MVNRQGIIFSVVSTRTDILRLRPPRVFASRYFKTYFRTIGKKIRSNTIPCLLITLLTVHFSLVTAAYAGEPPKRIVSLAPSMTEILYALGLGDNIVGVTSFCDYPGEAKKKPKIGGMSNPSLEAVVLSKPDIVVVTTDGNPKEFEERLRSMNIKTYIFRARRISELPHGIREMGAALGVMEKADALADEIETSINNFRGKKKIENMKIRRYEDKKSQLPNFSTSKIFKVLFIVWPEPLIVAGPDTAINDAIKLLGHENIASDAKAAYPKYSVEEVIHRSPDIILIGSGMSRKNIKEVSHGLLNKMQMIPAVKNNNVCYVSDRLYRLGPRVMTGIEEIAGCLK